MNLIPYAIAILAILNLVTLVESVAIFSDLRVLADHGPHGLCPACTHDLDEFSGAASTPGRFLLYLAKAASRWPIYRGWRLLARLRLITLAPIHDGPCDLDHNQATATTGRIGHQAFINDET